MDGTELWSTQPKRISRQRKSYDEAHWCVVDKTKEPITLLCTRCKASITIKVPVEVDVMAKGINSFCKEHELCAIKGET